MNGPTTISAGKTGPLKCVGVGRPVLFSTAAPNLFYTPADRAAYRRKIRNRLGTSSGRSLLVPIGADGDQIAVFPLLVDFLETGELVEKFVVLGEEKANHHDF